MSKRFLTALAAGSILLTAGCGGGAKIALDPESAAFYETARLIMTGEEKDIFNHLPDQDSRREFIADFWQKRDPDTYTEENEFKTEFYARLDYANKHFKEGLPGWKTERGRIYVYMGPPDKTEEYGSPDKSGRGSIIWWIYYNYELGIEFADEKGNGTYKMRDYDGNFFEALNSLIIGRVPYRTGAARKFVDFKVSYDNLKKEIEFIFPAEAMSFKDEGEYQSADLEFQVYVYDNKRVKVEEFQDVKTVRIPLADLGEKQEILVAVPHEFRPGEYYLDTVAVGKDGALGKTRKIVKLKIK